VERVPWPALVLDRRRCLRPNGPPGPVFSLAFLQIELRPSRSCARGNFLVGPRRSHFDPGGKVRDDAVRKLAPGRHLQFDVLVVHGLDQPALFGMPGNDNRTALATLEEARLAVEKQIALEFPGFDRMAFETVGAQNWPDLFLKKFGRFGAGRALAGKHRGHQPEDAKSRPGWRLSHEMHNAAPNYLA